MWNLLKRLLVTPLVRQWRLVLGQCPYCARALRPATITPIVSSPLGATRWSHVCPKLHFARRYIASSGGLDSETIDASGCSMASMYRVTLS
jgi:hypothetical protein